MYRKIRNLILTLRKYPFSYIIKEEEDFTASEILLTLNVHIVLTSQAWIYATYGSGVKSGVTLFGGVGVVCLAGLRWLVNRLRLSTDGFLEEALLSKLRNSDNNSLVI